MATKYGIYLRNEAGESLTGLNDRVFLRHLITNQEYPLSNEGCSDRGYYFHPNIPDGVYWLYIDGIILDEASPILINNVD